MPTKSASKKATQGTSPALKLLLHVWEHAPYRSHDFKGNAMFAALKTAIKAGLEFHPGDIKHLYQNTRAGYWMTSDGEGLYDLACGSQRSIENTSAAIAFETHKGRPAWLWAEETKTPTRLHIGATFIWKGLRVKITSFNDAKQSLVACTYKQNAKHYDRYQEGQKERVGRLDYMFGDYRPCEVWKQLEDGSVVARYGPPQPYETSSIDKRFTITHAELMATRKAYDDCRRKHEKAIKAAKTLPELDAAQAAASAEGRENYRHFDLEILKELLGKQRIEIERTLEREEYQRYQVEREIEQRREQEEQLPRWLAGEDTRLSYFSGPIRCRVKNGKVEVTNGNSVTIEGARAALAFVLKRRKNGFRAPHSTRDEKCDGHTIECVSRDGVTIGCTHFEWAEIDRIAPLIRKA